MNVGDFPFLDHRFVAIAHRGGWTRPADAARENTVYAFERAVDLGFSFLEIDVRTTADGKLVLFHDARLERLTGASGRVRERTWRQLRDLRIGGLDPVPLLEDVLDRFPATVFNIDLKDNAGVPALVALLRRMDVSDRIVVASFSTLRIRRFASRSPGIALGATPLGVGWDGFVPGLRRWRVDPAPVLQVPARVLGNLLPLVRRDLIDFLHSTGRKVHVWTIDDRAEMERLIDLGVDGLISNDLVTLKSVLTERGLWEADE